MSKMLLLVIAGLAVLGVLAASCAKQASQTQAPSPPASAVKAVPAPPGSTTDAAKTQYTCSMHPEVISDKPGKCPKCGMDLIEKKAVKTSETSEGTKDWYCPKHPDKPYAKGEKCEVCGGELAERKPGDESPSASESAATSTLPIGNAKDSEGHYLCPVMKNPVKDLKSAEHLELGGKVWYFCCPGCPDQFKADPKKYAPDIKL